MARVFIKAKIRKNRTKESTNFKYPDAWDSTKIHVVAFEDNPEAMGEVEEFCIGVVTPETWEILKKDPDIVQVTADKANEHGRIWRPQKVRVLDQEKVILALAKTARRRTTEENATLDSDNAEIGINISDEFDIKRFVAPGQNENKES